MSELINSPFAVPIVGTIFGTAMIAVIVAVFFWYKAREKELRAHQDLRIREMEHQRRMKELDVELEKAKADRGGPRM